MNENEAIERIKYRMYTVEQVAGKGGMEDLEMAIKALEEVRQYRETGHTPAMVRDLIRGYKTEHKQNMKLVNELEDYQMIGTLEECRVAMGEADREESEINIPGKRRRQLCRSHREMSLLRRYIRRGHCIL